MKRVFRISMFSMLGLTGLFAQPYLRSYVSGSGNDNSLCGVRSNPCATFSKALSQTFAGGEIDALDSGEFGELRIQNSVTIDGGPGIASVSTLSGLTCTGGITAAVCLLPATGTAVIVLRNLTINLESYFSTNSGIQVNPLGSGSANVTLENIQVIAPTGYCVINNGGAMVITDSHLKNCGTAGVYTTGNAPVTMENLVISNSLLGLDVGTGGAAVSIRNSNVSQNGVGISVASGVLTVDNTLVSKNSTGITAFSAGVAQISGVTVTGNATGLSATGGGIIVSFVNNRINNNTTNGAPTSSVYMK